MRRRQFPVATVSVASPAFEQVSGIASATLRTDQAPSIDVGQVFTEVLLADVRYSWVEPEWGLFGIPCCPMCQEGRVEVKLSVWRVLSVR